MIRERRARNSTRILNFLLPGVRNSAGRTLLREAVSALCEVRSAEEQRARRVKVLEILAKEWDEELDLEKFETWGI